MQAPWFAFVALGWALGSWVYFDATERGKRYPAVWGLFVFAFGWALIPEVVYLSVRNQGESLDLADGLAVRQYLVTTSFTSVALAVAGASTALAASLAWAVSNVLSTNDLRDVLASSIAAMVVGAAIWLSHWRWIARQLDSGLPDPEFRALYALRRTEMLSVSFLLGALAAVASLWALGGAFSALLHATYAGAAQWLPAVGPALFCGAAAAYHARYYRKTKASEQHERFELIPAPRIAPPTPRPPVPWTAPPSVPAPAPPATPWPTAQSSQGAASVPGPSSAAGVAAFCGSCGARGQEGDSFCRACGARLGPPSTTSAA